MTLKSRRYESVSFEEAQEYFYQRGWTDGLPVTIPTEDKVQRMLGNMKPDSIVGGIPERQRLFTAEKVAVNAVMAGCLPEYFPIIVTAVQAMTHPDFGLHGPSASTAGAAILIIVNGPIVKQVGMNAKGDVFGPGNRANATIGRAVRLLLRNVGGLEFDRSTLGHPGKFSYCIAEDEDTAWSPLHVQLGNEAEISTVTVLAAEGPNQVHNHFALKGESILHTIADRMRALGSFNMGFQTQCALVICKEHYETLNRDGWTKELVQNFLFEHARRPLADLKRNGILEGPIEPHEEQVMIQSVPTPEDIFCIVAGGEAGRFSAFIPGWGRTLSSRAVTLPITACGDG